MGNRGSSSTTQKTNKEEDRARRRQDRIAREESVRVWLARVGKGPTETSEFSSEMNCIDGHAFAKRKGGGFEEGDEKAPKKRRIRLSLEDTKKWDSSPPTGWVRGYDNGLTVYTFQGEAATPQSKGIELTPAESEEWNLSPPTGFEHRYEEGLQVWYHRDKAARRSVIHWSGSTHSPRLWSDGEGEMAKMFAQEESHSASPFNLSDSTASTDPIAESSPEELPNVPEDNSIEDQGDMVLAALRQHLQRLDGDSPEGENTKVPILSLEECEQWLLPPPKISSGSMVSSEDALTAVTVSSDNKESSGTVVPIGGRPREKRARETDSSDVKKVWTKPRAMAKVCTERVAPLVWVWSDHVGQIGFQHGMMTGSASSSLSGESEDQGFLSPGEDPDAWDVTDEDDADCYSMQEPRKVFSWGYRYDEQSLLRRPVQGGGRKRQRVAER